MSDGPASEMLRIGQRMARAARYSIIDRTRQNHAIEHATVAVLLERGARPPLAGNATPGEFYIYGKVSKEEVASAASEALGRLKQGARELAVSPYCGTNLVVGALIAGLISAIIMGRTRGRLRRIPVVATAVLGSALLGRPVGNMIQRRYTTLADVEDVEITGVNSISVRGFMFHRVRTRRIVV